MNRRGFLKNSLAVTCLSALPPSAFALTDSLTAPGWRDFEVVSRIEILEADGTAQAWLPLPSVDAPDWVRNGGNSWSGNATRVTIVRDPQYGAEILHVEWDAVAQPVIEVASRVTTRDRPTDFSGARAPASLDDRQRRLYTAGTALIPIDGIVRETSTGIVKHARDDEQQARAIYDWIVENTARNPKTRGCGLGNIRFMLESGDLTGKCADLNSLYVGLCRSIGLPARDVYGVRVAESRLGYKSLGRKGDVSKAQHCRAEVWLDRFGWVPVDPADVRKVILEEKPALSLDDPLVREVRARLFGYWEMNWMPYNTAHDVELPGSRFEAPAFLMYPQAEVAGRRLDSLDPEHFHYTLTAREVDA